METQRKHRSRVLPWGPLLAAGLIASASVAPAQERPARKSHPSPPAHQGGTVVSLCDGETSVEVKGLKPGQAMSREQAQSVSNQLMADWRKKNPGAQWDEALAQAAPPPPAQGRPLPPSAPSTPAQTAPPAARPGAVPQGELKQAGVYENYTSRDELVWATETQKFVELGSSIFHSDQKLGGTIGVSCDMCHPNAANTHPETYPKYQVQLQRVALLRDMINWCIENPVKGHALADDDPKLRAMEAYILAQRKGFKLDYGKH